MANLSKKKGTNAESKVVRYLEDHGFVARRLALAGSNDPGDIEAYAPDSMDKIIIEVKAGKQTAAPNRTQIEEWCRQTKIEAKNSNAEHGVLVVVRFHRNLKDADVYIPYEHSRVHWYFDDWVNHIINK
jgi:Holliday junction resolvase